MKNKLASLFLVMLTPAISYALTEKDFAYNAVIKTDNNTPFYELTIPSTVYKTISRDDLGDLRIINGAGQIVPHGLRNRKAKTNEHKETGAIPFYPLYQEEGKTIPGLHLNIKRNNKGEVINIRSQAPGENTNKRLMGYLLDLRQWKKPVNSLTINWKETGISTFIRKLKIAKSNDLEQWQHVASGKTLVNMSFQNHELKENTIKLSITKTNYLRLIYEDNKPGLELDNIHALYSRSSSEIKQNWETVSVSKTGKAGEYSFNHELKTLLRQLEIELPENNTVVRVQALSRMNSEQSWRYRGSNLLYRLSVNGSDIKKTTLHVSTNRDKQWLLRIDQQGGGLGSGLPVVKYAWQPQQLVFVARGQPPYKMIWGSAQVKPVLVNANNLLPSLENNKEDSSGSNNNMISTALLQENLFSTGNKTALLPKEKGINWQHWILWLTLILAAIILIWMALRLMKKMDET